MTHYPISLKKSRNDHGAFQLDHLLALRTVELKEITWQAKGKCSYKEPYFCKWTIKKARVSLFAWGSSLTAWYVALALSSSSVLSEEKKKETRAQPLSHHFLANKKQAIVNRFYEFYRAFCRLHVFALNSDWFSFAAHGEIKAKQKKRVRVPTNRPLPSSKTLTFKMRPSVQPFFENEFYLNENENHFYFKGWALNLVLIQRFGRTRKWPN